MTTTYNISFDPKLVYKTANDNVSCSIVLDNTLYSDDDPNPNSVRVEALNGCVELYIYTRNLNANGDVC